MAGTTPGARFVAIHIEFSAWAQPGPDTIDPMLTVLLLVISNTFMTFAWYGHLKHRNISMVSAILVSWFIALGEYCFQVQPPGPWTVQRHQLKIIRGYHAGCVCGLRTLISARHSGGIILCFSRLAAVSSHSGTGRAVCTGLLRGRYQRFHSCAGRIGAADRDDHGHEYRYSLPGRVSNNGSANSRRYAELDSPSEREIPPAISLEEEDARAYADTPKACGGFPGFGSRLR
jgi:hypothetical protein